jgi:glycosyltransferase involved in cell wall biosynthesis
MTNPSRSVLFVSKTIEAPWNDGSKVLVRDLAAGLSAYEARVYALEAHASWGANVVVKVPPGSGSPMRAHLAVMGKLLVDTPPSVFHFVFAPNLPSSTASRLVALAHRLRGWHGATVQTVASRPKDFAKAKKLLFGDIIVCQSKHTRDACVEAGVAPERLRIVPPFIREPEVTAARIEALREKTLIGPAPYVLYPGDLEFSNGAITFARAIRRMHEASPKLRFVFACRPKTPRAAEVQRAIVEELARERLAHLTYHLGEVADPHALIAGAEAVLFPVNDLYGKVDLPLVLLEAMALRVPVVSASYGPLAELAPLPLVREGDPEALAEAALRVLASEGEKVRVGALGRKLFEERYTAAEGARAYEHVYDEALARRR